MPNYVIGILLAIIGFVFAEMYKEYRRLGDEVKEHKISTTKDSSTFVEQNKINEQRHTELLGAVNKLSDKVDALAQTVYDAKLTNGKSHHVGKHLE